ncbi:LTA synthase family protein [Pseudalkalibacillus caeni]|uniref:LTA synthase family protein n=1 Tax=Exobacillus caeni TaxID=2574798 RepID=A0A5R9FAH5_9BACL|nr:LTA synthase family protein [Pseudalkalibacillus caeni]TLS39240.1 LTA synthase family protein [Pseudalkalibacillus caeni]
MKGKLKQSYLLALFILSLISMELVFRFASDRIFDGTGLFILLIFSITAGSFLYLLSSFSKSKSFNRFLSIALLGSTAFMFSSQLIYFKIFRTYYSLYSARNAGQVAEFWRDALTTSVKNGIWILLFFLPALLLAVFGKRVINFKKISWSNRTVIICCMVIVHAAGLLAVYGNGRDQLSAYDLYFKNRSPIYSVKKLGVVTTMRLDLQRLATGWSPVLETSPEYLRPSPDMAEDKAVEQHAPVYNMMDIDFDKLISKERNTRIRDMHNYFKSVLPTPKNNYTGKYKGYNLIFITAEAFSPYAVDKDVTPTLYKMVNEGFRFTNFYNPIWGVSTSDGEYVACTGLIPKEGVWSFYKSGDNRLPFVMGNQLKKLGYKTNAYHNHSYSYYKRHISHPNMGYDYKAVGKGLDMKKTWPESDLEMIEKTVPEYVNNQPFHAYYMTVSGHMQYSFNGNFIAWKNRKYVQALPYSQAGKAYIATQVELDRALKRLNEMLEEAGVANNTLIALSADHYPYGLENKVIDELAGHHVERNFELYKSPFILYTKGMQPVMIDKPASSLDIIPTLSNLLGLEFDSRLLMGRDILSDAEPLVLFNNKSFITDKGRYNSVTGTFTPSKGVRVEKDYVRRISAIVDSKFYYAARILELDYYRDVVPE